MPMQLFGVSKATLYGFFAPLVNFFPLLGVAMAVDLFLMILPDVPGNYFGEVCRFGTSGLQGTVSALRRV